MATSLIQDLRRLRRVKRDRDARKKAFEKSDHDYKQIQSAVLERMEAAEVTGMKVDGTNFVPSATVYGSIQDRGAFIAWAKENDTSLVSEKEEAALVNQLVRERHDNGEPLPPGVGFYVREIISQRTA